MSHWQFTVLSIFIIACGATRIFAQTTMQPVAASDGCTRVAGVVVGHRAFSLDDDDDDDKKPSTVAASTSSPSAGRYCFGLLDHRSSYGNDFFHDPFFGPEFDSERQIEIDYLHGEKRGVREDEVDGGFEWNVAGQLSIAAECGWDSQQQVNIHDGRNRATPGEDATNGNTRGFEDVDLAIYHPVFQYVSADGQFDYTAVARLDVGIPTRTPASGSDVQLTPYLGHLLRIGNHLSIQGWTGSQFTIAPDQIDQLIYGASVGYAIFHEQLPVPLTEKLTPIVEIDGQAPFSGNGQDALVGVVGSDVSFRSIGGARPHIELGYEIPLDQGAREELRWGVIAELFLEF